MSPMNRKRHLIGITALCTAAWMASAAIAAPEDSYTISSLSVTYHDADLALPDGPQLLYRRIQGAAKLVCHQPDQRELARYTIYRQCFDRAVDAAVAKVNVNALTAYHRSKTQRTASG
jgi:UrcA family protein